MLSSFRGAFRAPALSRFFGVSKKAKIGKEVFIAKNTDIIGDVEIGDESIILPQVVIRGDVNKIKIGKRTNVQDGTIIHATGAWPWLEKKDGFPCTIGDDVTIGHKAMIHGCTIHDRVLVGMSATILDGAIIESDVMIGAGAMVTSGKRLESGYLYVGAPAKKVRELTTSEKDLIRFNAKSYTDTSKRYLKGEFPEVLE